MCFCSPQGVFFLSDWWDDRFAYFYLGNIDNRQLISCFSFGEEMDCSCWKERTGIALRLGVQAGPEQNELNQESNVWTLCLAATYEHRALCSSAAVDNFILCVAFGMLRPCWPLFARVIVVRKAGFRLGFVLL